MNIIKSFSGKNKPLSNFYPAKVYFNNLWFTTVEHAYQASKSTSFSFRQSISILPANSAGRAKSKGRNVLIRRDWENIKIDIMFQLLCQKFMIPELKEFLISTGDCELIEGNVWHDNFWGDCSCQNCFEIPGQNWLGILIMEVRRQINEKGYCDWRYTQRIRQVKCIIK